MYYSRGGSFTLSTEDKEKINIFKWAYRKIKLKYSSFVKKCSNYSPVWRGSVIAVLISFFILSVFCGLHFEIGFGKVLDLIIFEILVLLLLGGVILLFNVLAVIFKDLQRVFFVVGVSAIVITGIGVSNYTWFNDEEAFIITVVIFIIQMILGASLWAIIKGKARILPNILLFITICMNGYLVYWFFNSGYSGESSYISTGSENIKKLTSESPANRGKYNVNTLTYGSGTDKRRSEFGEDTDIVTHAINARPLLGTIKGFNGKRRKLYWGFNENNFPINGRVWYPDEEGQFPLVLIVHGNHSMEDWSDDGYEYLGTHLASKGYIAASVDENFLNGSWSGDMGCENDVRGWMLLKHLELWDKWSKSQDNIFYNKVDFNNISLIGHSRGGEAVAIAAAFNKLKKYPNDADIRFNFNYNIKSIIAIAPTDGQYKPTGKLTPLENVDYLVIQGSNDGDVSSFYGSRQYNRIKFTDGNYHFKTSLYIGGANHGQFNTSWGNKDLSFPDGYFLNVKALLKGEAQREIAKVYITAFLDTTLKGSKEYVPMFKNYEYALNWLYDTTYMNRFEDSNYKMITNFEEDIDITSNSLKEGQITANNMYYWREKAIKLRDNIDTYNSAVYLQWRNRSNSSYTIDMSKNFNENIKIDKNSKLVFSIGDTGKDLLYQYTKESNRKWFKLKEKEEEKKTIKEIDLSVELIDVYGNSSQLPVSDFGSISPAIKVKFTKLKWLEEVYADEFEPNFQTFMIPIHYFINENSNLDYKNIKQIKFVFNRDKSGEVMIDDIGFEIK